MVFRYNIGLDSYTMFFECMKLKGSENCSRMGENIVPMDGVMLGFIARELNDKLVGGRVDKITQPEKDEIILTIRNQGENRMLLATANAGSARLHLTTEKKANPLEPPTFCMLMRKMLIGSRIVDVQQIQGDRIIGIDFDCLDEMGDHVIRRLICEFMGRHSNLIFTHQDGKIIDSIIHVTEEISRVREVLPGLMYRLPPEQGKLCYDSVDADALAGKLSCSSGMLFKALSAAISGLSVQTAREITLRATGNEEMWAEECGAQQTAQAVAAFLQKMPSLARPMLLIDDDGNMTDVTPFEYLTRRHLKSRPMKSVSEALEEYFKMRDQADRIHQKSSTLSRVLKNNIERCEKKLGLQMQALMDSARMEEYRIKGELLTASLYQVEKGMQAVELTNYYDPECKPMLIELDVKLSPGANAQRYFKLYQKARSARNLAAEQKAKTEEELNYLCGQLDNLRKCSEEAELFEIRAELEQLGYVKAARNRKQMKNLPPSRPLKFTSSEGQIILVGKNNLQNDKLTASAQPDEIWMHAKDMPGSHVIIVGENPGRQTMEEAASLAAWYSSGRASGRVPIDYTRRRYVKKPGGAKPGFVIYTHQRTLIAQPREKLSDNKI